MTYEKEMDYKTYLDFVLAMDNKREPQALQVNKYKTDSSPLI